MVIPCFDVGPSLDKGIDNLGAAARPSADRWARFLGYLRQRRPPTGSSQRTDDLERMPKSELLRRRCRRRPCRPPVESGWTQCRQILHRQPNGEGRRRHDHPASWGQPRPSASRSPAARAPRIASFRTQQDSAGPTTFTSAPAPIKHLATAS